MTRRLALSRETLTELTAEDLSVVVGGIGLTFLTCNVTCWTE